MFSKKHSGVRFPSSPLMKQHLHIYLLIAFGLFVFLWIYVRPVWVRSSCYKQAYALRQHENDYIWSEGKMWLPKPENAVTSHESYVWIYPDQATSTRFAEEYGPVRAKGQKSQFESCLLQSGIKP